MNHSLPLLTTVRVASPCHVPWADMTGDDRMRHCAQCDLDVFNLSDMTRDEADAFVRDRIGSGRTCIQFYQRPDGTMLTRDCPVGLARVCKHLRRVAAGVAASIAFLVGATSLLGQSRPGTTRLRAMRPLSTIANWLSPPPPPMPVLRGEMCIAPNPPVATTRPAVRSTSISARHHTKTSPTQP